MYKRQRVAVELLVHILCFISFKLGYCSILGSLYPFCSRMFNFNASSPMRVRDVTDGIRARSCDHRLPPESCIFYSRLGSFM